MRIRIAALGLAALLAGCTPAAEPSLTAPEAAELLAAELGGGEVVTVTLLGSKLVLENQTRGAELDLAAADHEPALRDIERRPELLTAPIGDFAPAELATRRDALTCPEGSLAAVQASSLIGGGMLQRAGCLAGQEFDVQETLLDGVALGGFDGWSAETIDAALDDIAKAGGATALGVAFRGPEDSEFFGWHNVTALGPAVPGSDCLPETMRMGAHNDRSGIGLLQVHCQTEQVNPHGEEAFPLADVDGAAVLDAMGRLAEAMGSDEEVDTSTWVELRDGQLVLSTYGAVDSAAGSDRRVPLNG